ncbi:MAG TPA: class I SAM-dependent methyltransferase [Firmicutes bacterium]|nr:class I SAM-dependent methyltransferase [Bacillota bacterium]
MQRAREKEHQLVDKVEAYEVLARYYDQLMDDIDYDYWCEYVLSLVERAEDGGGRKAGDGKNSVKGPAFASRLEGKRVLDLACGTGQFSYRLQQRGLKVTAVDRSPEMLAIAEERARSKRLEITFICQDMRRLELPSTYDLVLCLCDSLNYLLEVEEVAQVLAKAAAVLEPGGHFVFDVNTAHKLATVYGNHVYAEDMGDFAYLWENEYHPERQLCCMDLVFFVQTQSGLFEKLSESHVERAYPPELLRELVTRAGLELLGEYADLTLEPPGPTAERITFHCRKPL